MAKADPTVYILYGEDEYKIAQTLAEQEKKLGAEMDTTRLDSKTFNLERLPSATNAMPFLAKRRVVVLTNILERLASAPLQKKFLACLENIPPTTALFLIENRDLVSEKDRSKNKDKDKKHWLESWAAGQGERVSIQQYQSPKGGDLTKRIQDITKEAGGQISSQAANSLAELVDGDPRLAAQEIQKLLAYVNYNRPIEADDVQMLTADVGQGDIFVLVDALGNRDGRKALGMLHRLLEYQEYYTLFGMVVRQFRMILLTRDLLDHGGGNDEITRGLKLYNRPWLAGKYIAQARRFTPHDLRRIYRRLLEVDEAVKSSQMTGDLALETLAASLTI